MRSIWKLLLGVFSLALLPGPVFGQAQFGLRSQQGSTIQTITDGATLTFSSEGIGQAVPATVTMTYRGTSTVTIGAFDLGGASDFVVTTNLELPVVLTPNDALVFTIRFTPTTTIRNPARLSVPFIELPRTSGAVNINLVGLAPEFGLSFQLLPRGNQTSIPAGGITFADTALNQTTSANFVISNRGSGPGTVNNLTSTGAEFLLGGVPLLPAVVQAGQDVRVTIQFTPTQLGAATGSVRVDYVGRSSTVSLAGAGIGPTWAYDLVQGSTTRPLAANESLSLPQTVIGEKSSIGVRVRNTGNADGVVTAIRLSGDAAFTLPDLPFLPQTLTPGSSLSFSVTFTPVSPGSLNTRLRVDDAFFNLSSVGLGSTLAYSATVGAAATTLANNGSLILPPTAVGATSSARVSISNTGNTPAFVNSISATGTVFTVGDLPALPARIGGGESVTFSVSFAPAALGSATGAVKVDAVTFNASGVGLDPPALPRVTFPGPTAAAEPATQIPVGITLATPYPVNLTGRLLLSFASDVFNDDPAVQFAAGGRALPFVIPANSTRALFGLTATEARLQSGTVAGTITLAATFATEAGNINLTPTVAPATTILVRPAAPRIRNVQLATRTATGFSVLVTGFATSRSVTGMAFTFTQATDPNNKDLKLETTSLNINVDGPFNSWYSSTASAPFGSQFTATVNFNIRGDIDAIQSVAVVASNAQGNSNSGSVNLR